MDLDAVEKDNHHDKDKGKSSESGNDNNIDAVLAISHSEETFFS